MRRPCFGEMRSLFWATSSSAPTSSSPNSGFFVPRLKATASEPFDRKVDYFDELSPGILALFKETSSITPAEFKDWLHSSAAFPCHR